MGLDGVRELRGQEEVGVGGRVVQVDQDTPPGVGLVESVVDVGHALLRGVAVVG